MRFETLVQRHYQEFFGYKNLPIKFPSGYSLSIQAGLFYYSWPRQDFEDLKKYESLEVAILNPSDNFVDPDSEGNPLEQWLSKNDPFSQNQKKDQIYSYVPKEDVQRLFEFLKGWNYGT